MLELNKFNNGWVFLISILLFYFVIKKIINLNKPFDENKFIEQYINQQKLKNKMSLDFVQKQIPKLTQYYVGI